MLSNLESASTPNVITLNVVDDFFHPMGLGIKIVVASCCIDCMKDLIPHGRKRKVILYLNIILNMYY